MRRSAGGSAGTATPGAAGWFVYVLRCRDGSLYTGATNDVVARLARHAAGRGARYTRSRLPVRLVFVEAAAGRSAALRREAAVKRLTRAEKLRLVRRRTRPTARAAKANDGPDGRDPRPRPPGSRHRRNGSSSSRPGSP